jgi:CRP/FNR family cyclic AMP-dependent transcriptional regulator
VEELFKRRCRSRTGRPGNDLHFPAGINLFDLEHPSDRLYLLHSGQIRLSGDHGTIIDYLQPGCFFGEKLLLRPRGGKLIARSLSPVEVSAFRKSDLLYHLQRDRRFALQLLRNLAFRLDRYEQTIGDFVTERAERRLARRLFRLAPARPSSGWVRFPFTPTNLELARMVGTTRWRISHFMSHFQQLGWLRRDKGLWIHREGLQEFLSWQ